MVNSTHIIQSRPSEGSANCTNTETICCDVTSIESFEQPMSLIFGVTESSQGNTHSALLLGFSAMPQYTVDTIIMSKDGLSLSVGSSISNNSPAFPRGLRMLWFVIGKHQCKI